MRWLVVLWLMLPAVAQAQLAGKTSGVRFDATLGLGVDGAYRLAPDPEGLRAFPGAAVATAIGGWVGKFDESFALGRYVAFSLRHRSSVWPESASPILGMRHALGLEVLRGVDLVVVGLELGGVIGAVVHVPSRTEQLAFSGAPGPDPLGIGAHLALTGGLTWRFRPRIGLFLRLEAGVDAIPPSPRQGESTTGYVTPTGALTLGLRFARERRRTPRTQAPASPAPPG